MNRLNKAVTEIEATLRWAEQNKIQLADKETLEKIIEKIKGIK